LCRGERRKHNGAPIKKTLAGGSTIWRGKARGKKRGEGTEKGEERNVKHRWPTAKERERVADRGRVQTRRGFKEKAELERQGKDKNKPQKR